MSNVPVPASPEPVRPVASPAEAEALIKHLLDVMDALLSTVEEETELVRAGRLHEATKLERTKAELPRMYIADILRIKASQGYLVRTTPLIVDDLRQRHDEFRALLQINLTVLATAHAVSESIMRVGCPFRKSYPDILVM
jgi:hypothetical protein